MRRSSVVLVSGRPELIDKLQAALDPVFDLVVMVAHPPSVLSVVGAVAPAAVVVDRSAHGLAIEDTLRLLQQEEPLQKILLLDDRPRRPDWDDLADQFDVLSVDSASLMPDLLFELRRSIAYGGGSWRVH